MAHFAAGALRTVSLSPPLAMSLFGGTTLNLNRFTGPGKVGIQSMYLHLPDSKE